MMSRAIFSNSILNFFEIVYFLKYPKNRSYWTVRHKCLIKEYLKIENKKTHKLKYRARWSSL